MTFAVTGRASRALYRVTAFAGVLLGACASDVAVREPRSTLLTAQLPPYEVVRFEWVSAACSDGGLSLAPAGFERQLRIARDGRLLRLVYDQRLAQPTCERTEAWTAEHIRDERFRFAPGAQVTHPVGANCGADSRTPELGTLQLDGAELTEVRFESPWCRGYDVRFTYVRVPDVPLTRDEVLRHFVLAWNLRDADAASVLFAADGAFVEPMTRSEGGEPTRHAGRASIAAWLAQAFSSTPWLGMQLDSVEEMAGSTEGASRVFLGFRYMDPRLAEPASGRIRVLFAGHEILEAELQWLSPRIPRAPIDAAP